MHRVLIVDDERLARREIAYLLREYPDMEVAGEAASVDEAVRAAEACRPDLILLDIQMPGGSGFELFDRARLTAHVIFVTAHDEFALRAFEVNALDYLVKPVNPKRLRSAIERYLHRAQAEPPPGRLAVTDSIFLAIDHRPRFVKLASIVCILAEGDYTRIIGCSGPIGMVLKPMKEWEALLPERPFCRIQRSAIINCDHVLRLEPCGGGAYQVHMLHLDRPLPMSRRYARRFRGRFEV